MDSVVGSEGHCIHPTPPAVLSEVPGMLNGPATF